MNKKKLHRSGIKKGYYERQFLRTERNKARRKARLARRKLQFPKTAQPAKTDAD